MTRQIYCYETHHLLTIESLRKRVISIIIGLILGYISYLAWLQCLPIKDIVGRCSDCSFATVIGQTAIGFFAIISSAISIFWVFAIISSAISIFCVFVIPFMNDDEKELKIRVKVT